MSVKKNNIEDLAKASHFDKRKGYDDVELDQVDDSKPTRSTDSYKKNTCGSKSAVRSVVAPKLDETQAGKWMTGLDMEHTCKGMESPKDRTPLKSPRPNDSNATTLTTTPRTSNTPNTPKTPAPPKSRSSLVNESSLPTKATATSGMDEEAPKKKCCAIL